MTNYETKLTPSQESDFQKWKSIYAPKDSGKDYDLRGAFKSGLTPNQQTGHWPDTFKKPNHPTFSNESIYAKDAPGKAGSWRGDTFIPPQQSGKLIMSREDERNRGYGRFPNTTVGGGTFPTPSNASYFPNANPGAGNQQFPSRPGVAEGQTRMDQIANTSTYQSRRGGQNTFTLPSGGTAVASRMPSGYAQAQGQPAGTLTGPYKPIYTNQQGQELSNQPNFTPSQQPQSGLGTFVNAMKPAFQAVSSLFSGQSNPQPNSATTQPVSTSSVATPTDLLYGSGKSNPLLGVGFGSGGARASTTAARFLGTGVTDQKGRTTVTFPSRGTATVGPPNKPRRWFDPGHSYGF